MLDLKFVRENPEIVKQNIRNKFQDQKLPLVDEVIALDVENRRLKSEADTLRANRNKYSKMIGALMAQGKRDEAEETKAVTDAFIEFLLSEDVQQNLVPEQGFIPVADMQVKKDAEGNVTEA